MALPTLKNTHKSSQGLVLRLIWESSQIPRVLSSKSSQSPETDVKKKFLAEYFVWVTLGWQKYTKAITSPLNFKYNSNMSL